MLTKHTDVPNNLSRGLFAECPSRCTNRVVCFWIHSCPSHCCKATVAWRYSKEKTLHRRWYKEGERLLWKIFYHYLTANEQLFYCFSTEQWDYCNESNLRMYLFEQHYRINFDWMMYRPLLQWRRYTIVGWGWIWYQKIYLKRTKECCRLL